MRIDGWSDEANAWIAEADACAYAARAFIL